MRVTLSTLPASLICLENYRHRRLVEYISFSSCAAYNRMYPSQLVLRLPQY